MQQACCKPSKNLSFCMVFHTSAGSGLHIRTFLAGKSRWGLLLLLLVWLHHYYDVTSNTAATTCGCGSLEVDVDVEA